VRHLRDVDELDDLLDVIHGKTSECIFRMIFFIFVHMPEARLCRC